MDPQPPVGFVPEQPEPIAKTPEGESGIPLEDASLLDCQRVLLRGHQTTEVLQANFVNVERLLSGKYRRANNTLNLQKPVNLKGKPATDIQDSAELFSAVSLSKIQQLISENT